MSEHLQLSAGRRLWLEQECRALALAWKSEDKSKRIARSDILYKLEEELWNDGYNILYYKEEVEAILERELDNVYKDTTTH